MMQAELTRNHGFQWLPARPQTGSPHWGRNTWPVVLPLLLLVVAIGAARLTASAIWYDEWWSIYYAGASHLYGPVSLGVTIDRVFRTSHEANPVGYYVLLNLWTRLVGDSVFAVRAWSLLLAPLAVAFTYRAAADLDGRRTGLIAAVLIGTSAFFIRYAYEARGYMQLVLFSAVEIWAYWRLTSPTWSRRPVWIQGLFAASLTGLLYTHYLTMPLIGATALYHLLFVRKDRNWWRVTGLAVLGILPFIPSALVAFKALRHVTSDPARVTLARDAVTLLQRLFDRFSSNASALVVVMALYALFRRRLPWFLFVVSFLAIAILNAVVPFIDDVHYLLALLTSLAIVLAIGLSRAPGRWLLLAVWVAGGLWTAITPTVRGSSSNKIFLPWPEVTAALQGAAQPHDRFVFALPSPDPDWLHSRVADYYLHDLNLDIRVFESLPDTTPETFDATLEDDTAHAQRLWVAYAPDLPPSTFALDSLKRVVGSRFLACEPTYQSATLALALNVKADADPPRYRFDGGITLDLVGDLPGTASGPTTFLVRSEAGPEIPLNTYSVALHILDSAGQIRAQMDYGLPGDSPHCHRAAIPTLPDGTYQLVAHVYAWQTGQRLSALDTQTGQRSDTIQLGNVTVGPDATEP